MRAAWAVLLLAACCARAAPPPAPPPAPLACQERPADPVARNRCVGWALDQILMVIVFRPHGDRELAAYVDQVGHQVAAHAGRPDLGFTFRLVDDPEPQSYGLLGGYVYLTTGALARLGSEAELAALLAHEVAHVALDHGDDFFEKDHDALLSDAGAIRRALAHQRDDEAQADERAVSLLIAAGYDPAAMISMLRRLDCERDETDPLDREHESLARRLARIARAIDGRTGARQAPSPLAPAGNLARPGGWRTTTPLCVPRQDSTLSSSLVQ